MQWQSLSDELKRALEAFKSAGASDGKVKKAQVQADKIAAVVDDYEGTFVSRGRTLAEVINQPATILFKMSFMSGILDHSEGPVTTSMKTEFQELVEEAKTADDSYLVAIEPELKKFEKMVR